MLQIKEIKSKKKRSFDEEVDGGNTHNARDESGGAEGCGGGSELVEKTNHDYR